ncbi:hypothetical protein ACFSRY_01905 [Pontibacter locisalis]|uniref:Lipoprotein n=1 Tax=Pontibacter locisalis TaxID=1719035 RepID=A0ABW5IGU3_9BACT
MRKSFLLPILFLIIFTSCKDDEPEVIPETRLTIEVSKQEASSTGSISTERTTAIIHVWEAAGRDFDVSKSPDIYLGNVYDNNSETYKTIEYGAIGSRMVEKIEPGRYFVYVLLPKSNNSGSLAYSYTYFDIKKGDNLKLSKTFSHDLDEGIYEKWDKNR